MLEVKGTAPEITFTLGDDSMVGILYKGEAKLHLEYADIERLAHIIRYMRERNELDEKIQREANNEADVPPWERSKN